MDTPDDVVSKRLRTLTVKAMENYEEKVKVYYNKLLEKRHAVEESLTYLKEHIEDIHDLGQEFCEYLAPQNTEQSNSELLVQKSGYRSIAKEVDIAIKYIDEQTRRSIKIETENSTTAHRVKEDNSHSGHDCSDGGRSSHCTHKEEEELFRKHNELELQIQKQRSDLKSNLNILKQKREVAEAEAELSAVKELSEEENAIENNLKDQGLDLPQSSPSEIVQNYVKNQILDVNIMKLNETDKVVGHNLNPPVKEFTTVKNCAPHTTTEPTKFYPASGVMDLTRYIMKKDLLMSRLSTFDDKPERYCSWKNSFLNILRELDATDSEQLDILNRWLNGKHLAKDCKANIKCEKCGKSAHCTAFHFERQTRENNGGERPVENQPPDQISRKCTEICDDSADPTSFQGKSCAKTLLVKVYQEGKPEVSVTTYAIIDDQRYILESLDDTAQLKCPSLIECIEIPISKREIATPATARHYKHLQDIKQFIPELDRNAEVMLLIGQGVTAAHHILDQRICKDNELYAQRLRLGWAIIGETCLGLVHTSDTITVNQTTILPNGRETNLKPCKYGFRVKDKEPDIGNTVFKQTREDNTLGLSQTGQRISDRYE
ncbi:unnamed protein product [Mytilus coruscus]|uniref:Uncharacterized protein n=1 Tax=Mytilus coruscus TaxID=42192 RepID=A0A6J8AR43_MYTCO|nr:unnamed protein product [Mytilus coruscus]